MATERRWALRNERGAFAMGDVYTWAIEAADMYGSRQQAERAAQVRVHIAGRTGKGLEYWHAVPVERETERTVREVEDERRYMLRRGGLAYMADGPGTTILIDRATTLTAAELLRSHLSDDWTPIPVEVTEAPGPWRVVEEEGE